MEDTHYWGLYDLDVNLCIVRMACAYWNRFPAFRAHHNVKTIFSGITPLTPGELCGVLFILIIWVQNMICILPLGQFMALPYCMQCGVIMLFFLMGLTLPYLIILNCTCYFVGEVMIWCIELIECAEVINNASPSALIALLNGVSGVFHYSRWAPETKFTCGCEWLVCLWWWICSIICVRN